MLYGDQFSKAAHEKSLFSSITTNPDALENLKEVLSSKLNDLYHGVQSQENDSGVVGKIFSNMGSIFAGKDAIGIPPELQAEIPTVESDRPWLENFRWVMDNWALAKNSPITSHISKIVAICIATGFLPDSYGQLHIQSIKVYDVGLQHKFTDAVSMLDALVEALRYFVECGVASWDSGSLSPFLFETTMNKKLDDLYAEAILGMHKIRAGEATTAEKSKFYARIDYTVTLHKLARQASTGNSYHATILLNRLNKLMEIQFEARMVRKRADLHEAAMGIIFFGLPGCGKSSLLNWAIQIALAKAGIEYSPELVAYVCPDDKYDSSFTNSTLIAVFDDVANRHLKYDPSLGLAKMIQMINNVPWTATKAAVEEKDTVVPDLMLVAGTTNSDHMNASKVSCSPQSLLRRLFRFVVTLRPEYSTNDQIDLEKFRANPRHFNVCGNSIKDLQTITIQRAVEGEYRTISLDGRILNDLNVQDFLSAFEQLIDIHNQEQADFMSEQKIEGLHKCDKCDSIVCKCSRRVQLIAVPEEDEDDESVASSCDGDLSAVEDSDLDDDDVPSLSMDIRYQHSLGTETPQRNWIQAIVNQENSIFAANNATVREELLDTEVSNQGMFDRTERYLKYRTFGFFAGQFSPLVGFSKKWWSVWRYFFPNADQLGTSTVRVLFDYLEEQETLQWWYWIPNQIWEHTLFRRLVPVIGERTMRRWTGISRLLTVTGFTGLASSACFWNTPVVSYFPNLIARTITSCSRSHVPCTYGPMLFTMGFSCWMTMGFINGFLRKNAYDHLTSRRNGLSDAAKKERDRYSGIIIKTLQVLGGVAAIGTAYCTFAALYDMKFTKSSVVDEQGTLDSTQEAHVNRGQVKNMWASRPLTKKAINNPNQTPEQLCQIVGKNLMRMAFKGQDVDICNAFFPRSNLCIIPTHIATRIIDKDIVFKPSDNSEPRTWMNMKVTSGNMITVSGTDRTWLYLPKCRSMTSLVKYLPIESPQSTHGSILWKNTSGDFFGVNGDFPRVSAEYHRRKDCRSGYQTRGEFETFDGLCGAILISRQKNPAILGMHVAGEVENKKIGWSQSLLLTELRQVVSRFRAHGWLFPGDQPGVDGKVGPTEVFDPEADEHPLSVGQGADWLHKNATGGFNALQPGASDDEHFAENLAASCFEDGVKVLTPATPEIGDIIETNVANQGGEYAGTRTNRAFYSSAVVPTIYAEMIREFYPVAHEYGPPKFGASMWAKSAQHTFHASPGFPLNELQKARQDYLWGMDPCFTPEVLKLRRPLTDDENLNGIAGMRFIDAINWNSSMGLGFVGNKRANITREYFDEEMNVHREIDPGIWKTIADCEDHYRRGERANLIFNAIPKDEPTKTTKDKVRLFQCGNIVTTLLVRKYFLPLARLVQMNPLFFECAIGINALSREWEDMESHVKFFKQIFDGDHEKYDLKMPADVLMAAFSALLMMARKLGYSQQDLDIMEAMVGDIIHPLVNYNGDVYFLDDSNPSGNPLTALINSIVNCLLARMGYFHTYPNVPIGEFRRYVHLITYGDDFKMGVSWWRSHFNFVSYQKYLKLRGMNITPSDKEAVGTPFLAPDYQEYFLQRTSVHIPEFNFRIGALSPQSIYKSLMARLPSSDLSEEEGCAMNLDNAAFEMAFHGREFYNKNIVDLRNISRGYNLAHLTPTVFKSHKEIIMRHKSRNNIE